MQIHGLEKMSLVDYDGYVACTLFTAGCNFRCPFCHNAPLVTQTDSLSAPLSEEDVFSFLNKRKGIIDAVVVSGGEPTLHYDLPVFLARLRPFGYKIKLDTNGTNPSMLQRIIEDNLVDYVAMDIKNAPDQYAKTAGTSVNMALIGDSLALLRNGAIPYELRTTVVQEFHTLSAIESLARYIQGAPLYVLQSFVDKGGNICNGLSAVSAETLLAMREIAAPYVKQCRIRGV